MYDDVQCGDKDWHYVSYLPLTIHNALSGITHR